eukprot:CAMPEP_0178582140 /NCGR_PEP_ID=MMETSP0697-20121206/23568_1 /TAXON_ID=265572 /ORGANISM="Extubocellulus spinifer, Strain CCMP396" /LENGTH=166 /DNA_ID=CAMNT_0020217857 /DNA_START=176 /DNA_END=676 /DNA_ORIENTATION=+
MNLKVIIALLLVAAGAATTSSTNASTNQDIEKDFEKNVTATGRSSPGRGLRGRSLGEADYGNWCGYGNTRSDPYYPCKDGVDCVCREHDHCLDRHGYHKCGCDYHFIRDLTSASCSNSRCEAYRVAALAAFQVKPCKCKNRHCIRIFGKKHCTTTSYWGLGGKPNC